MVAKPHKKNHLPGEDPLLEVMDSANRPLLIMPQKQILRQGLRHRASLACLRNASGRFFLHKFSETDPYGGLWSLGALGLPSVGESFREAAERRLREEIGVPDLELYEIARFAPSPVTSNAQLAVFITAKTSAIPRIQDGMFVDEDELRAFAKEFPQLVSPLLPVVMECLFPGENASCARTP